MGDLLDTGPPDASFDAVVCVFGIFFVPDMPAAARSLWRHVRPGGKLAVTTWGPRFLEPASTVFWESIRAVRPDLHRGFNPWERVCEPATLRAVLEEGGVPGAEVVAEASFHEIASPADWWAAVMGSGYRGTVEQLSTRDRERVRETNLRFVDGGEAKRLESNVVYAVARKG